MALINPGALVHITNGAGFQTSAGTLTDPTTVTFRWRVNGGTETAWIVTAGQVVKDSTGLYHADVQTTVAGTYAYRWEGVGALIADAEGSFVVTSTYPGAVAPWSGTYASLPMFRDYLRNGNGPNATANDAADVDTGLEQVALEAAARAIDRACGRTFNTAQPAVSSRAYSPQFIENQFGYFGRFVCEVDDIADTTGLLVNFDASGNGDYTLPCTTFRVGPADNPSRGLPYNRIIFNIGTYIWVRGEEAIQVQALWGWSVTPATIVNANLLQAARYIKRRDAAFGVTESPTATQQTRLLSQLDPDVQLMVSTYQRVNIG